MSAAHKRGSEAGKRARRARKPADTIARAQNVGTVSRAEYLSADDEAAALQTGPDGLLDAKLERVRDRLLVATSRGWLNPKSRTAYGVGLYSFQLRGSGHYAAAVKAGRFSPGTEVRLIREPDNPHDPNAIAIYAERARAKVGFVPKGQAKRLATLLDSGAQLVGISTRGTGAGREGEVPQILVCERRLMDHLRRNL